MKTYSHWLIASALIAAGLPAGLQAQEAAMEPDAMNALNQMGAYLRTLKSFQVTADVTSEDVLTDGQKVQYSKTTTVLAQMPNRLYAHVAGDKQERHWFYNGQTFTLFAQRAGYYATVNAPASIAELSEVAWDKYGVEIPLVDLFMWGGSRLDVSGIKGGTDLGPSQVQGVTCQHYAFRQEGLDWQIWIQKGDHPLPRKLVLTTLTDEARPQHSSVLSWNLAPSYNDATFTFDPPEGAQKIVFASAAAK